MAPTAARLQHRPCRRAGESSRQAGAGDPEELGGSGGLEMTLLQRDLLVGCRRLAVEDECRILGRVHGRDRERGMEGRMSVDEARVYAEARERSQNIGPEFVVANCPDDAAR